MKTDELFALLRRRGVLWPTAEIYGGAQGLYDYGPIGAALKRRVEEAWSAWFVGLSDDFYLIDASDLLPEAVVRASGHLANFTDPELSCAHCHQTFRAETVLEKVRPQGIDGLTPAAIGEIVAREAIRCPNCGSSELGVPRPFNLMFGLDFGAQGAERAYLRPETAQSSYLAFPRMWDVGRRALPLGIAVIGHVYRNEIAPRQVLFRMRAFNQAELQVFFAPADFSVPFASVAELRLPVLSADRRAGGESRPLETTAAALAAEGRLPEFYVYYLAHTVRFYTEVLGYPAARLRLLEKNEQERAFYNRIQFDVELELDSLGGYRELGAVHYRGDYDLSRHASGSGRDLSVVTASGGRVVPHGLVVPFGVDRNLWALADTGVHREGERTVWSLPPYLAPVPVAVFPLLKKEHGPFARALAGRLRRSGIHADYDDAGSIGRRYARHDEIGTPFCITVDGATIDEASPEHSTVTVRERESRSQRRLPVDDVAGSLRPQLTCPWPGPEGP